MRSSTKRQVHQYESMLRPAPDGAPPLDLGQLLRGIVTRHAGGENLGYFIEKGRRQILMVDAASDHEREIVTFLLAFADVDGAAATYRNFNTGKRKDFDKATDDGVESTAHVVVSTRPDRSGVHPLTVEHTTGLGRALLLRYLNAILKPEVRSVEFERPDGSTHKCNHHLVLHGLLSDTLKDALETGTLKGFDLMTKDVELEDWDQPNIVKAERRTLAVGVSEPTTGADAVDLIGRMGKWGRTHKYSTMRVRFDTDDGLRQPTITTDDEPGETLIVSHRTFSGLTPPLLQSSATIHQELASKMRDLVIAARGPRPE